MALALAFPKANLAVLAPLGTAALFRAWYGLTPRRAFLVGWFGGFAFLAMTCSWVGETAGALIAPFGFLLVALPALIDGLAFGAAGALAAVAHRHAPRSLAPLAAAAAFTCCEWMRSIGPLGAPFANLSYTQVASPLAPLAAYAGSFGVTFVLCTIGAYLAHAAQAPRSRSALRALALALLVVTTSTAAAWAAWPARSIASPSYPVAAVQGNIKQDIKWTQAAFAITLDRYDTLTQQAAQSDPAVILWPETVMPTNLNQVPWLLKHLGALAHAAHAELIVGAQERRDGREYNSLYFFHPDGALDAIYRKRLLVPFAETLPAEGLLDRFPGADLVSRYSSGTGSGIVDVGGARVAPLICWESAFDAPAREAMRDGAQALLIATDDAWFGSTAGPYEHAQIAQMRALETGAWILRAGATGISGIIAPTGRYVVETPLDEQGVAAGFIGPPAKTLYDAIGSAPISCALAALYAVLILPRRRIQ